MNKFLIFLGLCLIWVYPTAADIGTLRAEAEALDWSFEAHPHPHWQTYSASETAALEKYNLGEVEERRHPCKRALKTEFKIYLDRYPAYFKKGTYDVLHRQWRINALNQLSKSSMKCVFTHVFFEFSDYALHRPRHDSFYYCGRFSRYAETGAERKVALAIEEAVELAKQDRTLGVFYFMSNHRVNLFIELNEDVIYFLHRYFVPVEDWHEEYSDVSHLIDNISPERRAFLDEAVKRNDLDSVLETTRPCTPRSDGPEEDA